MYVPRARVSRAVIANAGWYTLPEAGIPYPYGLLNSGITEKGLERFLSMPVTVLLGDKDNNPDDENLRKTELAKKQGPHRLARGAYFFASGNIAATKQDIAIVWNLARVHGADHSNRSMAPAAVQFLLEN
jgi:hypothetical protein